MTLPTRYISRIFGVIIPYIHLSKCTKTRLIWHRIAHKTSKHHLRLGLCPRPRWETYDAPLRSSRLGNWTNFYHIGLSPQLLNVQCPLPDKKFLYRRY